MTIYYDGLSPNYSRLTCKLLRIKIIKLRNFPLEGCALRITSVKWLTDQDPSCQTTSTIWPELGSLTRALLRIRI